MSSSAAWRGCQPASARIRRDEATSTAGSPGRRAAISCGTAGPRRAPPTAITSSTEWPAPLPRFQVRLPPPAVGVQMIQRQQMRLGQVGDVDVVAHAGAVRRRIVGAEHLQRRPAAERGVDRQRDQVRLRLVILAEPAGGIGAGGIEVAQHAAAQPVDAPRPMQRALQHALALAVRDPGSIGASSRDRRDRCGRHRPRRWRTARSAARRGARRRRSAAMPSVALSSR